MQMNSNGNDNNVMNDVMNDSVDESTYVPLKGYDDYEIETEYPHTIRRISNGFIPSESYNNDGYIQIHLNRETQLKHRLIANQFIPNDDPLHKTHVDHRNKHRYDNRISNLRWVTPKENSENKTSCNGVVYEYVDEISEDAIEVTDYGNHSLEFYYYSNDEFYYWNGVSYRKLHINTKKNGAKYVNMKNLNNKNVEVYINKFKRLYDIE